MHAMEFIRRSKRYSVASIVPLAIVSGSAVLIAAQYSSRLTICYVGSHQPARKRQVLHNFARSMIFTSLIIGRYRPGEVMEAMHSEHGRCNQGCLGKLEWHGHDALYGPQW